LQPARGALPIARKGTCCGWPALFLLLNSSTFF